MMTLISSTCGPHGYGTAILWDRETGQSHVRLGYKGLQRIQACADLPEARQTAERFGEVCHAYGTAIRRARVLVAGEALIGGPAFDCSPATLRAFAAQE